MGLVVEFVDEFIPQMNYLAARSGVSNVNVMPDPESVPGLSLMNRHPI